MVKMLLPFPSANLLNEQYDSIKYMVAIRFNCCLNGVTGLQMKSKLSFLYSIYGLFKYPILRLSSVEFNYVVNGFKHKRNKRSNLFVGV